MLVAGQTFLPNALTAMTFSEKGCRMDLNRIVISQNRHVWVCRCIDDEGNENVVGRVEQDLGPFQNTIGHEQAILRCQRRNQQRLLDACQMGTEQYQITASAIIETCVATRLNLEEKAMDQPFSFDTDRCGARFVRFISPRTGGVWICECVQEIQTERAYFVVSGRSAFLTDFSPLGAEEEVAVLGTCTTNAAPRIDRVCRITPGDFQLLSLQMLEVCCKRARVDVEQKFQCRTAVPDDVSSLKAPFLI
ncbi:hypothetical protein FGB62_51g120 [Gracilaria domingensis]|nr:hypothetical protein FGB62_51g120 [Gracilaria domingensis]